MRFRLASRRRTAIGGLAALTAASLLWSAAWLALARGLDSGIEGWVRDRRAEGWTTEYEPYAIKGFPFRWRARIGRPRLSHGRGFSWSGPWIELGWAPWHPRSVALWTAGSHRLQLIDVGGPYRLAADEISGRLGFGEGGIVERIDLDGNAVILNRPGDTPDGATIRVDRAILRADLRPDAPSIPGTPSPWLSFDADLLGLTLPQTVRTALGRTIGRIAAEAMVTGSPPAARPVEALTAWRDQGGTVEFSKLSIGWGPLAATGSGTLALDGALQPEGAFTARVAGYGETIDLLGQARALTPNQAMVARLTLGALARTPAGGDRPEVTVAVGLQSRTLSVGPVPLLTLPRIDW